MPSIITHAVVAWAASGAISTKGQRVRARVLSIFCAVLPDADVLAFSLGIPYQHPLGHRGFFHSPVFAMLLAIPIAWYYLRSKGGLGIKGWLMWSYFFLLTTSHGLLDAMTSGGLGIALLSPFSHARFFFPWTPIMVSPIGISSFFTTWGLEVLLSEAIWIWTPLFTLMVFVRILGHRSQEKPTLHGKNEA